MKSKRKQGLYFKQPQYTKNLPLTQIVFMPFLSIIYVEIEPKTDRDYGLIAGMEGLGSEFFADSQGNLYAIDIDVLPLKVIYVELMELLNPVKNIIKSLAKPGILTLENYPNHPINPDEILIFSPFGTAIFSFDKLFIDSVDQFFEQSQSLEFVQVGMDIIFGIDRNTRKLMLLMVENFNCVQMFSNTTFDREKYGQKFMDILDDLHLEFYKYPDDVFRFDKFVDGAILNLNNLISKLSEYNNNLELEKSTDAVNNLGEHYKERLRNFLKMEALRQE